MVMRAAPSSSLRRHAAPGNPPRQGGAPPDLTITVRERRFAGPVRERWWLAGDPVATAWHNALSATFPRGEAFFIESVRACREGAPPELEAEIRAFIRQEVNHTREHLAFNRMAENAGYDLARIDARVSELLAQARGRPPAVNVAITMALEHFTAMFAHEFLANPRHFAGAEPEAAALWRWHAAEEIEHKGVACDTFDHFTRAWPKRRRWMVRALTMELVTRLFLRNRWVDTLDLLAQDGITGWRARVRLLHYLMVRPGVLRRVFPAWLGYFRPGFHPWDRDDRALIAAVDAALPGSSPAE